MRETRDGLSHWNGQVSVAFCVLVDDNEDKLYNTETNDEICFFALNAVPTMALLFTRPDFDTAPLIFRTIVWFYWLRVCSNF